MPITLDGSLGVTYPDGVTQSKGFAPTSKNYTISSNLTLTASDAGYVSVTATTDSLAVILPDARQLTQGNATFTIACSGLYQITVRDNAGNNLFLVNQNSLVILTNTDNTIQRGAWAYQTQTSNFLPRTYTFSEFYSSTRVGSSVTNQRIVAVSSTQVIIIASNGSNIEYNVATLSGGTWSFGATQTVALSGGNTIYLDANYAPSFHFVKVPTTSSYLLTFIAGTTRYVYAATFSGGLLSFGTATTWTVFTSQANGGFLMMPTGVALFQDTTVYNNTTSIYTWSYRAATVSGNTLTFGSVVTLSGAGNGTSGYFLSYGTPLSNTTFIHTSPVSSLNQPIIGSLSGVTITFGTPFARTTGTNWYKYSDTVVFGLSYKFNYSGTTISSEAPLSSSSSFSNIAANYMSLRTISGDTIYIIGTTGTGQVITDANTIRLANVGGLPPALSTNPTQGWCIDALDANTAVVSGISDGYAGFYTVKKIA